jgi:hypothetical protein
MCCLLTWISDPQKEKNNANKMGVYSYTIFMTPIFYHLNQIVCKEPPNAHDRPVILLKVALNSISQHHLTFLNKDSCLCF